MLVLPLGLMSSVLLNSLLTSAYRIRDKGGRIGLTANWRQGYAVRPLQTLQSAPREGASLFNAVAGPHLRMPGREIVQYRHFQPQIAHILQFVP